MKKKIIPVLAFLALLFFDQWTKYLAIIHLKNKEPISIIKNVFSLFYLENKGAAFGIFQGKQVFFFIITTIFIIAALIIYKKIESVKRFLMIKGIIICMVAGAVGNLIDRVRYNYVVDFFYFELIDFPIFNVADIYVTLSCLVLFICIMFYYKDEDFDKIFGKGNK